MSFTLINQQSSLGAGDRFFIDFFKVKLLKMKAGLNLLLAVLQL